ncbi:MAG: DUF4974 domain-containing protein [Bacteroides sp.]|nr:DUF4974 domain-containing protein [Bacteroides sp.]
MEQPEFNDDLIVRYLAGEVTEQEKQLLISRIGSSAEVAEHFLVMKNIWEQTDNGAHNHVGMVSDGFDKVTARIKKNQKHYRLSLFARRFQQAAAVMLLPLIAVSVYLATTSTPERPLVPVTQELTTMPGTRMHTLLPDSTEIWMNGGSRLLYTQTDTDNRRLVELTGEVFFKVAHDSAHPFMVHTENVDVEALGTEFNVCSYATDSLTTVTLTDGSVKVTDMASVSVLSPGQTIIYNENLKSGRLYLGNTDKNTSWRHGRLVFKNEPLINVYKRIGQIYGLKFEVDPKLQNVLFYATFEDASLEQILQLIRKSTSLRYLPAESIDGMSAKYIIRVKSGS